MLLRFRASPCGLSSAAAGTGQTRHALSMNCGLKMLSRATASSCRGPALCLVPTAASTGTAQSPAEHSDKGQGIDGSAEAASSATVPLQSAGSIPDVLAACKGSGGPIGTLDDLLAVDAVLGKGYAQSWASQGNFSNFLATFRALTAFKPQDTRYSPELRQAAAAARRSLMHGVATAFMSYAPKAQRPIPLAAALLACAKVGYGWGSGGDGGGGAGAAKVEVPLAAVVLKRLGELAEAPGGLRDPDYRSWVFDTGVPYNQWDTHMYLWEAMAAAPPAVAAAHARLLDASAEIIAGGTFPGVFDTAAMLKALAQLHPLVRDAGPLARFLVYDLALRRCSEYLSDEELCEAVQSVGELLLDAPTVQSVGELLLDAPTVRRVLTPMAGHLSGVFGVLVREGRARVEAAVRRKASADAGAQQSTAVGWSPRPEPNLGTQDMLRLLRGCAIISEACSVSSDRRSRNSSSRSGDGSIGGGSGGSGGGSDYDYTIERYGIDAAPDVALQAAAAGQYVAAELEGQAFRGLSPQDLPGLALSLARVRYGTDRCYRNVVTAATARATFSESATPADWAQLWHALALVRHRPDDALVRCTAAALTTQQQYGSATAEDCSTLLLSLAELRCYDGGLVEGLLGRLVQLVVGECGGVEVRDLTNAVWAVVVMGPEALQSHCGAVGQLLREVVAVWEQGRVDVGSQQELRQLWQVQLELEGLVDGGAESSGGGSSNSSSPGQLRGVLPPDLLGAAEERRQQGGAPEVSKPLRDGCSACGMRCALCCRAWCSRAGSSTRGRGHRSSGGWVTRRRRRQVQAATRRPRMTVLQQMWQLALCPPAPSCQ